MNKANILVVDDTPANLQLLMRVLGEAGYKVRPANSGARALAAIQKRLPDLILLDISMPGMDGYEVCTHIKADERTQDIPIMFISALNEVFDKVKAFSWGAWITLTNHFSLMRLWPVLKPTSPCGICNNAFSRRMRNSNTKSPNANRRRNP